MFGKKKNIIEKYQVNAAQAKKLFLQDVQNKAKNAYYPTSVSRSSLIFFCFTFLSQVGFTQTIPLDGSKQLYLNNVAVET